MPLRLMTIAEDDTIYVNVKREGHWISQVFQFSIPIVRQPARLHVTSIPGLRMVGLVLHIDTNELYLMDLLTGEELPSIAIHHH